MGANARNIFLIDSAEGGREINARVGGKLLVSAATKVARIATRNIFLIESAEGGREINARVAKSVDATA